MHNFGFHFVWLTAKVKEQISKRLCSSFKAKFFRLATSAKRWRSSKKSCTKKSTQGEIFTNDIKQSTLGLIINETHVVRCSQKIDKINPPWHFYQKYARIEMFTKNTKNIILPCRHCLSMRDFRFNSDLTYKMSYRNLWCFVESFMNRTDISGLLEENLK